MFDAINAGHAGMAAFSQGLSNISNNVSNLNTTGFKRSALGFHELLTRQDAYLGTVGNGVAAGSPHKVMTQGEMRSTGNALDAAIDGSGYFILQDAQDQRYTRDGSFEFDSRGLLVGAQSGLPVLAYGNGGGIGPVSLAPLRSVAGVATTLLRFEGSLSTSDSDRSHTIAGIVLFDALGAQHAATITFVDSTDPLVTTSEHTWDFTLADDSNRPLASGTLAFGADGSPNPGSDKISFAWNSPGNPAHTVTLDFGAPGQFGGLTSFSMGTQSTAALAASDGSASGALISTVFGADGSITAQYSNGQTRRLGHLALAFFAHPQDLAAREFNLFSAGAAGEPLVGRPGSGVFGRLAGGRIEASNVDLTSEFSELITVQRGFQGASQVVSTANEMTEHLLQSLGGRR